MVGLYVQIGRDFLPVHDAPRPAQETTTKIQSQRLSNAAMRERQTISSSGAARGWVLREPREFPPGPGPPCWNMLSRKVALGTLQGSDLIHNPQRQNAGQEYTERQSEAELFRHGNSPNRPDNYRAFSNSTGG